MQPNKLDSNINTAAGFEHAYRAHVNKLCRIAYNATGDEAMAENIVHNVFASLWARRKDLQLAMPVEHYLVRAVKLAALDYMRTQTAHREHLEYLLVNADRTGHYTDEQVGFNELSARIRTLSQRLPGQCSEVYRLSRENGMTNREISAMLGIAEKTVEAHLTKALRQLRLHLADYQL